MPQEKNSSENKLANIDRRVDPLLNFGFKYNNLNVKKNQLISKKYYWFRAPC